MHVISNSNFHKEFKNLNFISSTWREVLIFVNNKRLLKSEYYAKQLIREIKNVLPEMHVNIALKTIKVTRLFSRSAKAPLVDKFDTVETVHEFVCPCDENYIGQCKRHLRTRICDHFQLNKGTKVYFHCLKCPHYKKKWLNWKETILISI